MFRLSSLPTRSRRPLSPWRRAVLFGAGLIALWLALQFAPLDVSAPPPVRPVMTSERLPVRPDVSSAVPGERLAAVPTRPTRSLLRAGNIAALLLLLGGVGWALYLRRRPPEHDGEQSAMPLAALNTLTLSPGFSLRLVRAGDEMLLLGLAQGSITLLRRYDSDEATVDLGAPAGDGAATPPFAELLHQLQTSETRA